MTNREELSREEIQEHFEYYELASMKRQHKNAQVCSQLLAAMDENRELKRLLSRALDTYINVENLTDQSFVREVEAALQTASQNKE